MFPSKNSLLCLKWKVPGRNSQPGYGPDPAHRLGYKSHIEAAQVLGRYRGWAYKCPVRGISGKTALNRMIAWAPLVLNAFTRIIRILSGKKNIWKTLWPFANARCSFSQTNAIAITSLLWVDDLR